MNRIQLFLVLMMSTTGAFSDCVILELNSDASPDSIVHLIHTTAIPLISTLPYLIRMQDENSTQRSPDFRKRIKRKAEAEKQLLDKIVNVSLRGHLYAVTKSDPSIQHTQCIFPELEQVS